MNKAPSSGTNNRSSALQGRVHDLGRRTQDGFSAFNALSKDGSMILDEGRGTSLPLLTLFSEGWTDNGGRLLNKWSLFFTRNGSIRDLVLTRP